MTRARTQDAPTSPGRGDGGRALAIAGALVAFVAIAGMVTDIVLTTLPGWGPESVPATAQGWLDQFATSPLLGLRNLDLLNLCVSVIVLPMYIAVHSAARRGAPRIATAGLALVLVGTLLFGLANAALPMLDISRRYAQASPAEQAALVLAAEALVTRGAHGGLAVLPGFLLSEIGTALLSLAMLRSRSFGRLTPWLGMVGATLLALYTTAYTFGGGRSALIMGIAVPAGLLMVAWHARIGVRLFGCARGAIRVAGAPA